MMRNKKKNRMDNKKKIVRYKYAQHRKNPSLTKSYDLNLSFGITNNPASLEFFFFCIRNIPIIIGIQLYGRPTTFVVCCQKVPLVFPFISLGTVVQQR